ncbi:LOW QUALITY PROTEIN: putative neural-cadherin 2 [Macrobrachium nipponense]|uniref:LOW QUALITY PROTEIN: putative neural-cadherin 2 n=1 Tax=Macrobrachium nipponense TaxID=159736 RepID=UPI0030C8581B
MAVNMVIPLLIPLEENLHNTTRLLPGGGGPVQFSEPRYCILLAEDSPPSISVAQVSASHRDGASVRYSITGGNRDGLFTIDQHTGLITLAAPLDFESHPKHELVVAAEAGGRTVHTIVQVSVEDINDNPPHFLEDNLQVTVIEEEDTDLPATIVRVLAEDPDRIDEGRLVYSVGGEGVDDHDPKKAFFTINPHSGELILLRALDRDPPSGRDKWEIRVQVRDGQRVPSSLAAASARRPKVSFRSVPYKSDSRDSPSRRPPTSQESLEQRWGFRKSLEQHGKAPLRQEMQSDQPLPSPVGHSRIGSSAVSFYDGLETADRLMNLRKSERQFADKTDGWSDKTDGWHDKTDGWHDKTGSWNDQTNGWSDKTDGWSNRKGDNMSKSNSETHTSNPKRNSKKKLFSQRRLKESEKRRKMRDKSHQNKIDYHERGQMQENKLRISQNEEKRPKNLRLRLPSHSLLKFKPPRRPRILPRGWIEEEVSPGSTKSNFSGRWKAFKPRKSSRTVRFPWRKKHQKGSPSKHRHAADLYSDLVKVSSPPSTDVITVPEEKFGQLLQDSGKKHIKRHQESYYKSHNTTDFILGYYPLRECPYIFSSLALNSTTEQNGFLGSRRTTHRDCVDRYAGGSNHQMLPPTAHIQGKAMIPVRRRHRRYVKRFAPLDSGGCQDYGDFSLEDEEEEEEEEDLFPETSKARDALPDLADVIAGIGDAGGGGGGRVHVVETVVTVVVKDVNDNPPVFPNSTIFGEVQENGPIDLSVAMVSAWDADDVSEGTNAFLTYSIEKNVIDERSGQAIFAVNPETGYVRTAICCLDRETTPEYQIQVVAVDGGGLKGTGTVIVRLADVNDNSPRITREIWQVDVNETWGPGPPSNTTLLQITTQDHDTSNYFYYRVVEGSGWGWQHFDMRTQGTAGELYAIKTLDYEDPEHRRGFRFMVQVTDRGRGGWADPRHTDTAWVAVSLVDLNDNPPVFRRPQAQVTVREDTSPGTLLATLPARDPDMGGQQRVQYRVVGGWGALSVDAAGGVRLWRALDREAAGGEVGVARVIGVDEGYPPLSSTATLTISVTDVNDCAPRLQPPTVLHVTEGIQATRLGVLTATDDDVWALGHGPPFNLSISPSNPTHVLRLLSLRYNASLDSGRGGGEMWTTGPIDREVYPHLTAEVVVTDAGGLAATHPVTIVIDDVNDNPMKPAAKAVYLWKTQSGGAEAALGRVYVEDPDDWDLEDKTFQWAGKPHPLFTLNPQTGAIYASTQIREGRYDLHFHVADRVWGQHDVSANVSVTVRNLPPEALAHAVPVTLSPATPAALTAGWTPKQGGGGLGTFTSGISKILKEPHDAIEIVSVYGHPTFDPTFTMAFQIPPATTPLESYGSAAFAQPTPAPFACVWVSIKEPKGRFMDPVKLQGLLALHIEYLESVMNLKLSLAMPDEEGEGQRGGNPSGRRPGGGGGGVGGGGPDPSSSNPEIHRFLGFQVHCLYRKAHVILFDGICLVVDTNTTSLVTPRLTRAQDCHAHSREVVDFSCTPTSCLNGGRCVRNDQGNRCICPGISWGPQCKILSRSFSGNGWAWARPLPPCLPMTLSIRVLTTNPRALILYWGPLSSTSAHPHYPPTPMLALQLVQGHPQVLLEGARGPLKLEINTTLSDGVWHTIHLRLNSQGVTLMVDYCGRGWMADSSNDSHCIARTPWVDPVAKQNWGSSSYPLQIGGMAHSPPRASHFGWSASPIQQGLRGCVSHLTVNGQLVDLGEPAYSSNSNSGCFTQEEACLTKIGFCGVRGHCVGGLNKPRCECEPGWTGEGCEAPAVPMSLGADSYMKMALSFKPDPYYLKAQMRVRQSAPSSGLLMQLASHHQSVVLDIRLRGGIVCASLSGTAWKTTEACVEGYLLSDGEWHTIWVERHGHNLLVSVDDGDGWRHNETLPSLVMASSRSAGGGDPQDLASVAPVPLVVDKQDGVTVGGLPEYVGVSLVTVHEDLSNICMDDIRVSGRPLPVPPAMNGTSWGQVTTLQQVEQGCQPPDLCANTTCLPPLACHPSWTHATCSCRPGMKLVGGICQDVDECIYEPCLFGGTCSNLYPGYKCTCGPHHTGENCQWTSLSAHSQSFAPPLVIAAVTLSLLVVVVLGVLLTLRLHRSRGGRGVDLRGGCVGDVGSVEGISGVIETQVPAKENDVKTNIAKEEAVLLESLKLKLNNQSSPDDKQSVSLLAATNLANESKSMKKVSFSVTASGTPIIETQDSKNDTTSLRGSVKSLTCGSRTGSLRKQNLKVETSSAVEGPKIVAVSDLSSAQLLPAQDDLRAYAYEGDGSPSGSLTSTVLGLRTESLEGDVQQPLIPEYGEVFDLLKTLPDSTGIPVFLEDSSSYEAQLERLPLESISSTVTTNEIRESEGESIEVVSHIMRQPGSSDTLRRSSQSKTNLSPTSC